MIIRFPLAVVYGLIIGWLVRNMSNGSAIFAGAIIGLAIYSINSDLTSAAR